MGTVRIVAVIVYRYAVVIVRCVAVTVSVLDCCGYSKICCSYSNSFRMLWLQLELIKLIKKSCSNLLKKLQLLFKDS